MCAEQLVPESQAPLATPVWPWCLQGSMQRGCWLPVYTAGTATPVLQTGRAEVCSNPQRKPTLFPQMKPPLQCFQDQSGICAALIVQVGWSPGPLSHAAGRGVLHKSLLPCRLCLCPRPFPVPPLVLPPPAHTGAAERTVAVRASLKNED